MKERILVVDTPGNAKLVRKSIQIARPGRWLLEFAASAKEAFDILRDGRISIVVCGTDIPGVNCFSFANEVTKYFKYINVILTGAPTGKRVSREKYLQCEAFDLVRGEPSIPNSNMIDSIEVALAARRITDTGKY